MRRELCVLALLMAAGCAVMEAPPRYEAAPEDLVCAVDMISRGQYDQARPQLEAMRQSFAAAGDDQRAAESLFWIAFCDERQLRTPQAVDGYMQVLEEHPHSRVAEQAARRLQSLPRMPTSMPSSAPMSRPATQPANAME